MSKPICIYHGGCADGFTAAWVVWLALGEIEFFPAVYGDAPPDVSERDVIMVDFSYKRPVIETMAATCRTMLILDHHKTAQADLVGIDLPYVMDWGWAGFLDSVHNAYHVLDRDPRAPFAIFDMSRSGAQIAWDFFHPHKLKRPIVEYVADRDLWKFDLPRSRAISAWLYSQEFSFQTWDICSYKLKNEFDGCADQGDALLRQHDKNVASLIRATKREMVIGGHRVPVVNVPHFMASDAGHIMASGHPFAASYYDTDGARVFSLRSHVDGADVSEIAASYGGGGHKNAAGFKMPQGWEGDE